LVALTSVSVEKRWLKMSPWGAIQSAPAFAESCALVKAGMAGIACFFADAPNAPNAAYRATQAIAARATSLYLFK
jgi:hypothetical protein